MRILHAFTTASILLLSVSDALPAQSRTRHIAEFTSGNRAVRVAARNGYVSVVAHEFVDDVLVNSSPGEARVWLDSVRAMIGRPLQPEPGEELEVEAQIIGYGDRMSVTRQATRTGNTFRLDFWDRHVINSVYMPVSRARLNAFLTAVGEAARAADRMRGTAPAREADSVDAGPILTPESVELIEDALTRGYINGPVALEMVVTPDGTVDTTSVYVVSPESSAEYALRNTIPRLRFTPAMDEGHPVRVRTRFSHQKGRLLGTARSAAPGAQLAAENSVYGIGQVESPPEVTDPASLDHAIRRNYPPLLRDAGITGVVQVILVVDKQGRPEESSIKVIAASHDGFSDAARRIVRVMEFRPAMIFGRPVRAALQLPITFELP